MITTFNLCKKLIEIGKSEVVNANIDLYLANNRLTAEEYAQIMNMLIPQDVAAESTDEIYTDTPYSLIGDDNK